jgi:hypothetical protein
MSRRRQLAALAAATLLLVPALAVAGVQCGPRACSLSAPSSHDCCPRPAASLLPGCCDDGPTAKTPPAPAGPERHLLVALAAPVDFPAPPVLPRALASIEQDEATSVASPLHAVLRL